MAWWWQYARIVSRIAISHNAALRIKGAIPASN
jgi:hypothetical protein